MNELEADVMAFLLDGDHETLMTLRQQLVEATVVKRDFTGVGFFTSFRVSPYAKRLSRREHFTISDVFAEVDQVEHGVGFVLFIRNRMLDTLEAYTFSGAWPANAKLTRLFYMRPRDGKGGMLKGTPVRDIEWALADPRTLCE